MEDQNLLNVVEVAERLRVTPEAVRRWLRDGSLKGFMLGDRGGWRIRAGEVESFISKRETAAEESRATDGAPS